MSDAGTIEAIAVSVDIPHTYIGDLRVTLSAPDGATVELHDGAGGSADNLLQRYTHQETAALATFLGKQGQGSWVLKVSDLAGRDTGKLQKWGLQLVYG